jgi:hypothetical protein
MVLTLACLVYNLLVVKTGRLAPEVVPPFWARIDSGNVPEVQKQRKLSYEVERCSWPYGKVIETVRIAP